MSNRLIPPCPVTSPIQQPAERRAGPRADASRYEQSTAEIDSTRLPMRLESAEVFAVTDVWDSWAELTRFLESARLAFARERNLWESLELADREQAGIKVRSDGGWFEARLDQHLEAVNDDVTLYASVLVHSYALMESAAADALGLDRAPGGVEGWGQLLLDRAGADWSDVRDGEAGAVEVAVVRNAFAHGTRSIDHPAAKKLLDAGAPPRDVGSAVSLTYDELLVYRGRMAHLLNTAGLSRAPKDSN